MKQVTPLMLALLAVSALTIPANAQLARFRVDDSLGRNDGYYGNSGINGSQARLQMRINHGLRNGSLTASEAAVLQARFNQIASLEARLRMQGLSRGERRILSSQLSRLSYDIDRQMNDFERRHIGSRGNGWWR